MTKIFKDVSAKSYHEIFPMHSNVYWLKVVYALIPQAGPTSRKPPTNTTSWSGSAMGSANKKYPVAIQAKLPITSSTRLSRPFKPPGRTKPQATPTERVDGVLRDDELLRMYADGGEVAGEGSSPKQVQPDASGNDSGLSLSK